MSERSSSAPSRSNDPFIGRSLAGRYDILSPLGQGGSSRVYRAVQQPLGREVALKVVRPDLDEQYRIEFEARFLREAALAGRLSHSGLVTIHDFGRTEDGACFLVMELLRGRSLRRLIRKAPLDPELSVRIAAELARGLRHAHNKGLVHRDVKPGNVFLVPDDEGIERAKLLDFGLVKEGGQSTISGVGTFMGTPHYIAPEQAKGLDSVDGRADLYSLGVVLFRMLTGKLPFEADNPMAIAIKHLREPAPSMQERAPRLSIDPELERIVAKCLEKRPKDRYQAAELAQALEEWLARRQGLIGGEPSVVAEATLHKPKRGSTSMLLGLAALLGLGILGLASYRLWQGPEPVPAPFVLDLPAEGLVLGPVPPLGPARGAAGGGGLSPQDYGSVPVRVETPAQPNKPLSSEARASSKKAPPRAPKPAPAPTGSVVVDGVAMSGAQATALLRFVNSSSEAQLRAAGMYGRGVSVVLEERPFASVQQLAATPYVGEKTIRAALGASQ